MTCPPQDPPVQAAGKTKDPSSTSIVNVKVIIIYVFGAYLADTLTTQTTTAKHRIKDFEKNSKRIRQVVMPIPNPNMRTVQTTTCCREKHVGELEQNPQEDPKHEI